MDTEFWVGGYTGNDGHALGISRLTSAPVHGTFSLAGTAPSPSWLALNPRVPVIYAALEQAGRIAAFSICATGTLEALGTEIEAGEQICHVAVSPNGRHAVASCYGDGKVIYYPLADDGSLGEPVIAASADNSHAELKDSPSRAHQALFLADDLVLTTDLGRDLLRVWRVSPEGLTLVQELVLDRGIGPRHMALHSTGVVFVVTEFSNEILTLAPDAQGDWNVMDRVPTAAAHAPGHGSPSEICLNDAGTMLYTAVRGANTISTFAVRGEPARLELLAVTPCGGDWPRHHVVSDGRLYVANQLSEDITVFDLDPQTGVPGELAALIPVPSPTCLVPVAAGPSA